MTKISAMVVDPSSRKEIELAHNASLIWSSVPRCKYRPNLVCGVPLWQCPWCRKTLYMPSPAELGQKAVA